MKPASGVANSKDEVEYLWDHWKFNADQRIKAFNFFVIFSVFSNGGLFTALEKCAHPVVVILIGSFIFSLALVFFMLDQRSKGLLSLSVPGLMEYESKLKINSRLFHSDKKNEKSFFKFTIAFRLLFSLQALFGIIVVIFGFAALYPENQFVGKMPVLMQCAKG